MSPGGPVWLLMDGSEAAPRCSWLLMDGSEAAPPGSWLLMEGSLWLSLAQYSRPPLLY